MIDDKDVDPGEGPNMPELSEALWRELERRIAFSDAHSEAGTPWEVVKARVLARLGNRRPET